MFQSESAMGSCSIHGTEKQPAVCKSFQCAWIRGLGDADVSQRPDQNGVLLSVSRTDTGHFGFAMEWREGAVLNEGRKLVLKFVDALDVPVIVSLATTPPPHDTGDYVLVKRSLYARSQRRLAGPYLFSLAPDVAAFELIKEEHGRVCSSV